MRRHAPPLQHFWMRIAESCLAFAASRALRSRRAASRLVRRDDFDDADAPARLISRLFVRWDPLLSQKKKLPGYPDGASRAAGKRLFPGRPGSKFWIAGKILSDFFRSRQFLAIFCLFKGI
jgi:hypothetical protein